MVGGGVWSSVRVRNSWDCSLRETLHFLGFYLQEAHQILKVKSQEKNPHVSGRGSEKNRFEIYQSLLHNEGLLSRRKDLVRGLWGGSRALPNCSTPLPFQSLLRREKLRNTCEGHSPRTQAH